MYLLFDAFLEAEQGRMFYLVFGITPKEEFNMGKGGCGGEGGSGGGQSSGKGGGSSRPANGPSTTGNPSGGGRGNNPPSK